jgi:hypothetical protein
MKISTKEIANVNISGRMKQLFALIIAILIGMLVGMLVSITVVDAKDFNNEAFNPKKSLVFFALRADD